MTKTRNTILSSKYGWLLLLVLLAVINFLASVYHTRIDLTKEKRYTLSKATKDLLKNLDEKVEIDVFMKGDFPAGFRKLANSTTDFLQLLKDRNGSKIQYRFISPKDEIPGTNNMKYGDSLIALGLNPINLTVQLEEGQQQNYIFPAALVRYKGRQELVNLYGGSSRIISQNEINEAEALLEYQFVRVLEKMVNPLRPVIGYASGHGEPTDHTTYDLRQTLQDDYNFGMFNIAASSVISSEMSALIIVKPTLQFSEADLIKLDQYVMRGGKLLCYIDNLHAEADSLTYKPEIIAYDRNLNLTNLFFRYGARINPDLVMDLQCEAIPFVVGEGSGGQPQQAFLHWNYYPLFQSTNNHPINRNIGLIGSRFVNSMDTINVAGVRKTVLLSSSPSSRTISTPALISLNENRNAPEDEKFKKAGIPVAMLLEGKFTSLYRNRISKSAMDTLIANKTPFRDNSENNKIIIVADGDMALNEVLPSSPPLPMGWNRYSYLSYEQQTQDGKYFIPVANKQFFQNCLEYLVSNPAVIETRNKNIVLRLLDTRKVKEQKSMWQFINIALPALLVVLFGLIYQQVRRRKYA